MEVVKLRIALIFLMGIVLVGTVGYVHWEQLPLFEAFYMTLITISTVGFGELKPFSVEGRLLTMFIIISGISLLSYTLGQAARVVVEGELRKILGRRKLEKDIAALRDHQIVCGFGRTGSVLVEELLATATPLVVIERDEKRCEILAAKGVLHLCCDATEDASLRAAGIGQAAGLITTLNSDAASIFVALSASEIRPDLYILARASDSGNESKLLRAGASRVVSPHQLGGELMAEIINKPTVVDFLTYAMGNNDMDLQLEEAHVADNSTLHGKTLIESGLRRDYGVIIIAIKRRNGKMVFNPGADEIFYAGDVIVVLGETGQLERMREEI